MGIRDDTIKNYLTDMCKCAETQGGFNPWVYKFVLTHGAQFGKVVSLPDGEHHGPKKLCFSNAFALTERCPELIFTEGFFRWVSSGGHNMITQHAWTVNGRGNVCDPTSEGVEYFGIPFKRDYAQKTLTRISPECTSLIENIVDDYPLMKGVDSSEWLYEMIHIRRISLNNH